MNYFELWVRARGLSRGEDLVVVGDGSDYLLSDIFVDVGLDVDGIEALAGLDIGVRLYRVELDGDEIVFVTLSSAIDPIGVSIGDEIVYFPYGQRNALNHLALRLSLNMFSDDYASGWDDEVVVPVCYDIESIDWVEHVSSDNFSLDIENYVLVDLRPRS